MSRMIKRVLLASILALAANAVYAVASPSQAQGISAGCGCDGCPGYNQPCNDPACSNGVCTVNPFCAGSAMCISQSPR